MHLLAAEWLSFSTAVSLLGLLTLCCSPRVPQALQLLFTYGKTQTKGQTSIPKRWFFHFYVFATCFYSYLGYATIIVYATQQSVPPTLQLLLNAFVGPKRRATVDSASVAIAMALMFAQVLRRLYECTRLSIYSERGRMALVHYLCGFFFYFGVGLSLLAEANGFNESNFESNSLQMKDFLKFNHFIGVLLFIISSIIQFKSHEILAKLRTDSSGKVVTYTHSIPNGLLFELVSCPHYLAEILIYLSVNIVFSFSSSTWWLLWSFVLANQVIVGIFNHNWYLERFHDYPKQRKAVFPFLL